MNAGIFQLRYLATQLIHQPDELAGVSIADSAIGRPTTRNRIPDAAFEYGQTGHSTTKEVPEGA